MTPPTSFVNIPTTDYIAVHVERDALRGTLEAAKGALEAAQTTIQRLENEALVYRNEWKEEHRLRQAAESRARAAEMNLADVCELNTVILDRTEAMLKAPRPVFWFCHGCGEKLARAGAIGAEETVHSHISTCEKHPMATLRREYKATRDVLNIRTAQLSELETRLSLVEELEGQLKAAKDRAAEDRAEMSALRKEAAELREMASPRTILWALRAFISHLQRLNVNAKGVSVGFHAAGWSTLVREVQDQRADFDMRGGIFELAGVTVFRNELMPETGEDKGAGANIPEPPPSRGNGDAIWDIARNRFFNSYGDDHTRQAVLCDMAQRDTTGALKYGVRLRAHNGRNALVDAYLEAPDLLAYLTQCLEEGVLREGSTRMVEAVMKVIYRLRVRITERDEG